MNKYVALDVETGGIGDDKSLLTVYLALLDENLDKVGVLSLAIKPDNGVYNVTSEALGINKINLIQHDKEAISEKQAGTILFNWLKDTSNGGKLIPIGHNVQFDIRFLQVKLLSQASWNQFVSYRVLDTGIVAQYLMAKGKLPNVGGSLGALANHYQVSQGVAHTADGDVITTINLLKAMLND